DQVVASVPTAMQRAGDFSQTLDRLNRLVVIYDPLTTRADPSRAGAFIRDPFSGNRIPSDRIHTISQKVIPLWGEPNRAGEGPSQVNNFYRAGKSVTNTNAWFARVDHIINDKHRIYGRAGGLNYENYSSAALNVAFPSRGINSNPTRSALISLTSTFAPNILGEGRISYTRLQFDSHPMSEGFDLASLAFPKSVTSNVRYQQFPQISIQTHAQ